MVDVSLGFEQLDDSVGIPIADSTHQRRLVVLRTRNDTLRDRPEVCGHPSSDTHVIFGVDVGLGFEQLDGSIGMSPSNSIHQRRPIILRAHNDILRDRPEVCGIPHLTRTLSLWLTSALASSNAVPISVCPFQAAAINGVQSHYERTETGRKCAGIPDLGATTAPKLF